MALVIRWMPPPRDVHSTGTLIPTLPHSSVSHRMLSSCITVKRSTVHLDVQTVGATCSSLAEPFQPIVFWMASTDIAQATAIFCTPTITLHNVNATVDIITQKLNNVVSISTYDQPNNLTGPPLNNNPFNGIAFDLTNADRFEVARADATASGLPTAILVKASALEGGLPSAYANGGTGMLNITQDIYVSVSVEIFAKSKVLIDLCRERPCS